MARTPALHAGGHGFKSHRVHYVCKILSAVLVLTSAGVKKVGIQILPMARATAKTVYVRIGDREIENTQRGKRAPLFAKWEVSSAGRASGLHPEGRRFEPCTSYSNKA